MTTSQLARRGGRGRSGNALYLEALEGRELFAADPTLTTFSISVNHAGNKTFTASNFADSAHDTLTTVIIETLPTHGTLTLGNVTVTAGQSIAAASLSTLVYTPTSSTAVSDSFLWNAQDGVHTYANATVNVSVLETAPVLSPVPLTTSHSNPISFASTQFSPHFVDAEGDALASITILTLPTHGTLLLSGNPITANANILAANLGSLTYIPVTSYQGADSFTWTASDGVLTAATSSTVNITVQESAPTVQPFNAVAGQNESVSFLNGNTSLFALSFTDVDAGDTLQQVKIIALPKHGCLTLTSGNTSMLVTANQVLSLTDIGNLVYTPATGYLGSDSFKWSASDGTEFSTGSTTANLDVRYFSVVANNNVLNTGDKSPSAAKFTDFGYQSTDPTAPTVTRTYTINDVGSLGLNFTGTPIVQITGANASDFTVTTQPSGNLTTGGTTTFVITFTPHGTGVRTATVTIPNTIPGQAAFNFAIKGTGITTGTTADGLILGQINGGTGGNMAASLDTLVVNYTGTLLNGTVFDTSIKPGGTPLQFTLGEGQVIAGWDEGLVNMKKGETRLLIVPPTLGYGSAGNGNVPGNATMIFSVTCVADSKPRLEVAGVGTSGVLRILPSDDTPSITDGTSFGTLPSGNTSVAHTFTITDIGGGVLGFPSSGASVTLTGANPSDFIASTVSFGSGQTNASFTLTFQPTAAGTRTAIVHVHTNDPIYPDFAFAVIGSSFFTDLTTTLGTIVLPTAPATVGGNTTVTVPVTVKNIGGTPVPANTPNATIVINIHDNINNITLPAQTFTNQNVSGLGLNQTRTFHYPITLPSGFDIDNATVTVTMSPAATETNPLSPSTVTTNNTVTQTVSSNLVPTLVSTTLLPQVVAGVTQPGNVVVSLKNSGNMQINNTQKVNITVTAVEAGGAVIPLGTLTNQSIASLAAGASKNFTVQVPAGTSFAAGTYTIHAVVTAAPAIAGELATDNDTTQTAAGTQLTVTSSAPFDNITGTLIGSTLPTSGANTNVLTGNVSVQVQNAANRALPTGEKVVVEIVAHNLDNSAADIVLATSTAQSISALGANKTQNITVPVVYTGGALQVAHYQIEALLVPQGTTTITESSVSDNLLTTKTGNVAITYNAQIPVNDFTVNMVSSSIGSKAANQALSGTVGVRILNAGNLAMPNPQHVTIQIVAHPSSAAATDHSGDIILTTSAPFSIANLAPGAALSFNVPVTFAAGLARANYQIEALIAPVETLNPAETNVLDNYGTTTTGNTTLTLTIT